jgi:hypothetical protein
MTVMIGGLPSQFALVGESKALCQVFPATRWGDRSEIVNQPLFDRFNPVSLSASLFAMPTKVGYKTETI